MIFVRFGLAVLEFAQWKRFDLSDGDWFRWGLLAIFMNSAASGATLIGFGYVGHRTSMRLEMSLAEFAGFVLLGAALGLVVGTIPALLVRIAIRAITRRLGYINGQLALLYAGAGVLLCFPLIGAFALGIMPTVLVTTCILWLSFRAMGGGIDLDASPTAQSTTSTDHP